MFVKPCKACDDEPDAVNKKVLHCLDEGLPFSKSCKACYKEPHAIKEPVLSHPG